MSHLTGEQFEDILRDGASIPEHVGRCPQCQARLDERRALAHRVRGVFSSIHAGPDLAGRIRADIAAAQSRPRTIPLRLPRYLRLGLGAAAAIVIAATFVVFYISTGSRTNAAQIALVEIHQTNISSLEQSANDPDPAGFAAHIESKMGHRPAMPCAGCGMSTCGCRVREFCGQSVMSCVVQGPNAPVSVIVVPHSPEALGMTEAKDKGQTGRALWQSRCGDCNMASVRIGEYSYCAVGRATQEELAGVLNALPR